MTRRREARRRSFPWLIPVLLAIACASGPVPFHMMDTPALYHGDVLDPFAHAEDAHHSTELPVYFATNRRPASGDRGLPYGNAVDDTLHLGRATLRFGDDSLSWQRLHRLSTSRERDEVVELTLEDHSKEAELRPELEIREGQALTPAQRAWAASIDADLERARDPEIMVYVHGTKVDFLNAVAMTAELDHFAGRDFVGVAYSWPSHQNILYYFLGVDVRRALDSSPPLRQLLEFLAVHTSARRINLISYSAGAKVASKALYELRQAHADLSAYEVRQRLRLGAVVFAAADVPVETFLERLPSVSDLAEQVMVTVSDHDPALEAAHRYMGHGLRTGEQAAEATELEFASSHGIANFHVVDVSLDQKDRGFDIDGHHYWYRHPWASSDILLLMRTRLHPLERALTPSDHEGVYYMSAEYPDRVRDAARRELDGSW